MRNVKKIVYSELVEFKYQFLLKNGELNTYIYLKNDRYDSVINKTQSKFYSFDCKRFTLRLKKQQKRIKCYKGQRTQTNARTVKKLK